MKRKTEIIVIAGISLMTLFNTSCESWLDVKPKTEIRSDVLFETESGFKDALIGVYVLMTSQTLYGGELTLRFMDVMAQQYNLGASNSYRYLADYEYEHSSVVSKREAIWKAEYNVIANVNNILGNLEIKKGILHPAVYSIIKGECLGLRAFMHLEVLRLYGYGDLAGNPQRLQLNCIPYVDRYTKEVYPLLTVREVLNKIQADLAIAEELLYQNDPDGAESKAEGYELPDDDNFFGDRSRRFNYSAVKATRARAWLWEGNYTEALACANKVIEHGKTSWVRNMDAEDPADRDYTFSSEHVFGLNVDKMYETMKPWILNEGTNENNNLLYLTTKMRDEIYEVDVNNIGVSDIRKVRLYQVVGEKCLLLKYKEVEGSLFKNNMCVIKIPEMYYIAAECLNQTGSAADREKAITLLNTVRRNRGISTENMLDLHLTQAQVTDEIYKEYRKEFIGEGQLFYYYKRLGYTSLPGVAKTFNDAIYVMPKPDVELEYGR